jgi:hypothetical protein
MAAAERLPMKSTLRKWIIKLFLAKSNDDSLKSLMGGIELVTPSMINGWVWHPKYSFYDVRLIAAGSLLSAARINIHRQDVEDKVGAKGSFAFNLKLPVNTSPGVVANDLQLFAMTSDGTARFSLSCLKNKTSTQALLRTALDPKYFGMEGNFDGLVDNGGLSLSGWCFQSLKPSEVCTVYLHVEGLKPVPITCNQHRPEFPGLGYPEYCGFSFRLSELASIDDFLGKRLVITFDHAGLLPLPEASAHFLPGQPATVHLPSLVASNVQVPGQNSSDALQVHTPSIYTNTSDLTKCLSELEEFKKICDLFEQEIAARIQQEAFSKNSRSWRLPTWKRLFGNS